MIKHNTIQSSNTEHKSQIYLNMYLSFVYGYIFLRKLVCYFMSSEIDLAWDIYVNVKVIKGIKEGSKS
jgi:hypothetical protein